MSIKVEDLDIGDTIERKKKYDGEGEFIVSNIGKDRIDGITACNTRYPKMNGIVEHITVDRLAKFKFVD